MQILPNIPENKEINFSYNHTKWLHEQDRVIIINPQE
jgi:hypothetical protein